MDDMDSGMDMGGMDMSGDGMTGVDANTNHRLARAYWYIAATVVGSLMVFRGINYVGAVKRCVDAIVTSPTQLQLTSSQTQSRSQPVNG